MLKAYKPICSTTSLCHEPLGWVGSLVCSISVVMESSFISASRALNKGSRHFAPMLENGGNGESERAQVEEGTERQEERERAWIRRRQNWLGRSVEGGVQETIVLRREVIDWCKASMRELLSVVCVLFRCLGKHVAPVAFSAPRLRVRCC